MRNVDITKGWYAMRRILIFILCCLMLTTAAAAAGRMDDVLSTTVVYPDGTADVVLTVKISLNEPQPSLTFPLPAGAENVRLNGAAVEPQASPDNPAVILVGLSAIAAQPGTHSLDFRYSLKDLVYANGVTKEGDPILCLDVPLLSGFEYPVDAMEFSITFPEGVEVSPSFYSGYFLQSIESDIDYHIEDGILRGTVNTVMKDRETLMMTSQVAQEGFPGVVIVEEGAYDHLIYMGLVAAAAWLFWLLLLAAPPVYSGRTCDVPPGIHAGEVASRVHMVGADLTALVFQWAQLGYIRIAPDRRGKVWLHKRMEMGNERTPFEVKIFRQLFGQNQMVEGTGSRFARLWHHVSGTMDRSSQITRGGLWARGIFRAMVIPVSALAGAAMGQNILPAGGPWQMVLMVAMALMGCFTARQIQAGALCMYRRRRDAQSGALICALLWIAAALVLRRPWAGVASVGVQFLAGIFAAWGGRRPAEGRMLACRLLGLRRYLVGAKRHEIRDALETNPDYFFEMAPFALAFGVEDAFAKRFGRNIMPQCGYLDAPRSENRTAREWAYIMRSTAEKLDNAAKGINQYRH